MNGARGFTELLRELARDGADLVRGEVRLVRLELEEIARDVGRGSAEVALGVVLLALGALTLVTGLVLVAGDQWLPRDRYWLAALVVTVLMGILSALLMKRGEGVWGKHPMKSGATSS